MDEITIYKEKELTFPVSQNLMVQDIKNSNINKDAKLIILASCCFPKINQLKDKTFPKGTVVGNEDLSGREIRQFEIRQHINKAILHSGYGTSLNSNEDDLNELISSVISDVLIDFSHLTTQEVGIAFKKGCREEYGQYMGVSTRIFYTWLKYYCSVSKIAANKALSTLDKPKSEEPTVEELKKRQKLWLDNIFKDYDEYVKTGNYKIYDTNNMFYDFLKQHKLIKLIATERKEIEVEAEKILRIENNPLQEPDRFKRNQLLEFIDKLNKKDTSLDSKILCKSKHIHLKRFLFNLRKKKKSLREIVTKKAQ